MRTISHVLASGVVILKGETRAVKATAAKVPNYTPEQEASMIADYQAGVTVEAIALTLGKTVRSVVAKLSRSKVYTAKAYVSKSGETVVKKDALADKIGSFLGASEAEIESLTKVNKTMLKLIMEALEPTPKAE